MGNKVVRSATFKTGEKEGGDALCYTPKNSGSWEPLKCNLLSPQKLLKFVTIIYSFIESETMLSVAVLAT